MHAVGARPARHRRRRLIDAGGRPAAAQVVESAQRATYSDEGPALRLGAGTGVVRPSGLAPGGAISIAGIGEPRAAVPGFANSTRIQGRTDADFAGSTYEVTDATTRPAKGCKGCGADGCKRVTGEVVMTFRVATTVTLPTPDADLTPCQRARVREAIRDILAPHEQQHVAAFRTYDGSLTRTFDLTMCQEHVDATIKAMFDRVEKPRRARAQARSDALDQPPFFFDVDLDCEEPPNQGMRSGSDPTDANPESELPS